MWTAKCQPFHGMTFTHLTASYWVSMTCVPCPILGFPCLRELGERQESDEKALRIKQWFRQTFLSNFGVKGRSDIKWHTESKPDPQKEKPNCVLILCI